MWAGDACTLYDRDWMQRTLSIPGKMAQLACSDEMPKGGLLEQLAERMQVEGVNENPIISVARNARRSMAGPSTDDIYGMECIIDERMLGRRQQYLVRWVGYPIQDATWEPYSAFVAPTWT